MVAPPLDWDSMLPPSLQTFEQQASKQELALRQTQTFIYNIHIYNHSFTVSFISREHASNDWASAACFGYQATLNIFHWFLCSRSIIVDTIIL